MKLYFSFEKAFFIQKWYKPKGEKKKKKIKIGD